MKRIVAYVLFLVLLFSFSVNVCAQDAPITDTFTHWSLPDGSSKTVAMRPAFEPTQKINARNLGLSSELGTIVQIKSDQNGNIYILTQKKFIDNKMNAKK